MNRRNLLKSAGALAGFGGFAAVESQASRVKKEQSPRRPNLLVFFTDDHAQWLQEAYGNTEVRTPNMTRLASQGVRMTNAFTTTPVCSPARASFFTGRMPSQHGIHDWLGETTPTPSALQRIAQGQDGIVDPGLVTESYAYPWLKGQTLISELLKNAGYHTGLVGKWHCGQDRYPHPGFDYWFTFWGDQYPHEGLQNFSENGKHVQVQGFQSALFSDRAISFLRSHREKNPHGEKPFFLFVGYTDTHWPHIQMPADLVNQYKDATYRDIPVESFPKCHGVPYDQVSKSHVDERRRREQYYAAASSIDRQIGMVLDELAAWGELDNTLVVYTSDHGLNAGQHGIWEKGNATNPQNFFEESIRVPCTLEWAKGGIPAGLECEIPVTHCDLFATLLDAAGTSLDAATKKKINSPGKSFLPHLRGQAQGQWRDGIVIEYGNARMARWNGYKLILRYPFKGMQWANELYDLRADPRETVNLYPNPTAEQTRVIAQLRKRIDDFFAVYTEPGLSGREMESQPQANIYSTWLHKPKPA